MDEELSVFVATVDTQDASTAAISMYYECVRWRTDTPRGASSTHPYGSTIIADGAARPAMAVRSVSSVGRHGHGEW
jgi:hypothetical protein